MSFVCAPRLICLTAQVLDQRRDDALVRVLLEVVAGSGRRSTSASGNVSSHSCSNACSVPFKVRF
jgi:hypothetical protein